MLAVRMFELREDESAVGISTKPTHSMMMFPSSVGSVSIVGADGTSLLTIVANVPCCTPPLPGAPLALGIIVAASKRDTALPNIAFRNLEPDKRNFSPMTRSILGYAAQSGSFTTDGEQAAR
jgi:hypothetical protein